MGTEKIWQAEYQAKDNKDSVYYPPENALRINTVAANDNKSIKSCPADDLFGETKLVNQLNVIFTTI